MSWASCALVVSGAALLATDHLIDLSVAIVSHQPMWEAPSMAVVASYALSGAMVLAAFYRVEGRLTRPSWLLPATIVALAMVLRAMVALLFDAPLAGENDDIHQQAIGVLEAANCCFSHRPMGYPLVLAGAYSFLGVGPGAIESMNIAAAGVTTWLTFSTGQAVWSKRVGVMAATIYAIMPSHVLLALPPLTEPLFTTAVMVLVRLSARRWGRPLLGLAVAGVAVAAAQYVRGTAVILLAPVVLMPFLTDGRLGRWVAKAGVAVAAFLIVMLPVIAYNWQSHGSLSVSTSAYGGWSLYVGTNQEAAGKWNRVDSESFAQMPGDSVWERSQHAGSLGIQRILNDPGGFLAVQPRKFAVMWREESYGALYAFSPTGGDISQAASTGWLLSQVFYVPVLLLALLGLFVERRRLRPTVLMMLMIIPLVTATHALLEVHSRYHAYLVPLLVLFAAKGLAAIRHTGPACRAASGVSHSRSTAARPGPDRRDIACAPTALLAARHRQRLGMVGRR